MSDFINTDHRREPMSNRIPEPTHVDEPLEAQGYADVISRVASDKQAIILRRDGSDVAAVVPLEFLEALHDAKVMDEAQQLLKTVNWERKLKENPPPQSWFDGDEPKP